MVHTFLKLYGAELRFLFLQEQLKVIINSNHMEVLTQCKNLADSWQASYVSAMSPFACESVVKNRGKERSLSACTLLTPRLPLRLALSIIAIMTHQINAHKIH